MSERSTSELRPAPTVPDLDEERAWAVLLVTPLPIPLPSARRVIIRIYRAPR